MPLQLFDLFDPTVKVFYDYEVALKEHFTHYDFIWAKRAPQVVYSRILDLLVHYDQLERHSCHKYSFK